MSELDKRQGDEAQEIIRPWLYGKVYSVMTTLSIPQLEIVIQDAQALLRIKEKAVESLKQQ